LAFTYRDVEDVGRRGDDADQDLIVADRRGVDVVELQHGGVAVPVEADCPHTVSLSFILVPLPRSSMLRLGNRSGCRTG